MTSAYIIDRSTKRSSPQLTKQGRRSLGNQQSETTCVRAGLDQKKVWPLHKSIQYHYTIVNKSLAFTAEDNACVAMQWQYRHSHFAEDACYIHNKVMATVLHCEIYRFPAGFPFRILTNTFFATKTVLRSWGATGLLEYKNPDLKNSQYNQVFSKGTSFIKTRLYLVLWNTVNSRWYIQWSLN